MAKMSGVTSTDYFLLVVLWIYFFVCEMAVLMVPFPGRRGLREKKLLMLMSVLGSHLVFALILFCEWDKRQPIRQCKNNLRNQIGSAETKYGGADRYEGNLEAIREEYSEGKLEPKEEALEVMRKERAKYEEERREWEIQRSILEEELRAVRKCAKLYRSVLHDYHWFYPKDSTKTVFDHHELLWVD